MERYVQTNIDADNVLTIEMDAPGKSVNTCSPQFLADLSDAIADAEQRRPAAVIFASAKPRSFNAGADLFEIRKMNREQVAEFLQLGQSIYARIETLPMPTIAAIGGDCLGGGFELALACRYRVAVDDGSINIGLPEVKIGLIPAWGGTTRLPRKIGLSRALPILLAGKTMPPKKAKRAGLVDETVRREALPAAAKRIALSGVKPVAPSMLDSVMTKFPTLRKRVLDAAEKQTREKTYDNYPAPLRLLEVVRTGYDKGAAEGFAAERSGLIDLSDDAAGRNLLRLFFLRQGAKKQAAEKLSAKAGEVKHAAVIGGGTMGAGIVHALVRAGIPVRLVEVDAKAVSAALGRIKKMLDDDVSAGRIDKLAARDALNRVSPTTEWTGLELADLIVEAALETIEVKRDIFARLDRLSRPTAVLASNTSSLRIGEMAEATLHPERVVGLHFFNPVPKMPLVEVVRGPRSDDASLATALGVAARIGKTPVLVSDSAGFLVNRILVPYLAEALLLAGEGVPIARIDDAAKRWGMPMGPFELLDEIGLDIAHHVLNSLGGATSPPAKVVAVFDRAKQQKWLGKKTGRGFYIHDTKGTRRGGRRGGGDSSPLAVNHELLSILSTESKPLDAEAIQWRLVLPMVNEAAKALEEGVTNSPDAVDLAMVFGTGLAPFRGGILHFANQVGAAEVVRKLEDHAAKHGPRFAPANLLREAAIGNTEIGAGVVIEPNSSPVQPVHS
ncbi:MAG: 3-hydroxyacyl-CoA dehydrogenase NAD-binding domain-containing protein [Tepidisphaeraceae bacterium]